MVLLGEVIPTTSKLGVANESISKTITNNLASRDHKQSIQRTIKTSAEVLADMTEPITKTLSESLSER